MSQGQQGGLKHVATEPSQLDSKRERRRGAGGRAAALRRAPSDSDCSGDTASLSADSAERAPRQPPQPTAKQRSRRRGSEWEVLEGLKDGQRFDRRPEVFNGYLHKKRKWPLKGWHKRFFVVDGGILVYARSPSDVNRGRLHGSVDVGLSVISAKARRRRIDIDADEFIYHLRAKTADVFRTWLSVLKAHRLYRQHLLMFGARESVPKIHAPLDEIPPSDSSRSSSVEILSSTSEDADDSLRNQTFAIIQQPRKPPYIIDNYHEYVTPKSMCSMKCVARVYEGKSGSPDSLKIRQNSRTKSPDLSGMTDMEYHMLSTDLEPLKSTNMTSTVLYECSINTPRLNLSKLTYKCSSSKSRLKSSSTRCKMKSSKFVLDRRNNQSKSSPVTALYYYPSNKSNSSYSASALLSGMRKSKKCTNLVKYRNLVDEPKLQRPQSGSMLLGNRPVTVSKQTSAVPESPKVNFQSQVEIVHKANKSLQDIRTASECDLITEKLMYTVLQNHRIQRRHGSYDTKHYISKIVKELYDTKFTNLDDNPAKILFKSLLEYWMKSTSLEVVRNTMKKAQCIDKPSHRHFTRNKQVSSNSLHSYVSREIQVNMLNLDKPRVSEKKVSTGSPAKMVKDKQVSIDTLRFNVCRGIQVDVLEAQNFVRPTVADKKISTQKSPKLVRDKQVSIDHLQNSVSREIQVNTLEAQHLVNPMVADKKISTPKSPTKLVRDLKVCSDSLHNSASREIQVNMLTTQSYVKPAAAEKKISTQKSPTKRVRDKKVSSITLHNSASRETQVDMLVVQNPLPPKVAEKKLSPPKSPRRMVNDSYIKDKRVQELERLLNNTVYICETACNLKEKDIYITKKLIDNIGKYTNATTTTIASVDDCSKDESSTELPKIQATMNQLLSDSCLTADIAKECLGAYLDVLLSDSTRVNVSSMSSTDNSKDFTYDVPQCDVQSEAIQKKVSKSVTNILNEEPVDPGQKYLKDILDKITNILSKVNKPDFSLWRGCKKEASPAKERTMNGDCEGFKQASKKSVFTEKRQGSYDVERMSIFADPTLKELMSFTMSIKDARHSPLSYDKSKSSDDRTKPVKPDVQKPHKDISSNSFSNHILKRNVCDSPMMGFKNSYINYMPRKDLFELRPFLSNSDATSKANIPVIHESDNSLDMSDSFRYSQHKKILEDECYVFSSFKKTKATSATKWPLKKKISKYSEIEIGKRASPLPVLTKGLSTATKIIDEKFILLLLENLTLLSQNVPSLHKDINLLYLKIKKKHDKSLKGSPQGLGLLGKIYTEGEKSQNANNQTAPSTSSTQKLADQMSPEKYLALGLEVAVNTSKQSIVRAKSYVDRSVLCFCSQKKLVHMGAQTSWRSIHGNEVYPTTSQSPCKTVSFQTESCVDLFCVDVALSAQKITADQAKDHGLSTMIQSFFDDDGSAENFRFVKRRDKRIGKEDMSKQAKMDWLKDYRLLPLTIKVSTQSQTERRLRSWIGKRVENKNNIRAYPVLVNNVYKPSKSSSVTLVNDANAELKRSRKFSLQENSEEMKTLYRCKSDSASSGLISPTTVRGPQAGFVSGTPGGRLASWIVESGGPLENVTRELGQAQLSVQQLQRLLDSLELQHQAHHDTDVSLEGASPNVKKDRRKFGLRKKKSNSKCASVELAPPPHVDISSSHMALSTLTAPPSPGGGASSVPNSAASLPIACAATRPQSLPGAESLGPAAGPASLSSLTPDQQLREDFTVLAKDLVTTLKGVVSTLVCERGRLRAAMDAADNTSTPGGAVVAALRTNLTSALQQNSELRSRLSRIHDASDLAEISSVNNSDGVPRQFHASLSYSSSCVSASEFFDAEEHDDEFKPAEIIPGDEAGVIELDGDSTSEAGSLSSEEGSASSDNSDAAMLTAEPGHLTSNGTEPMGSWTRRTRLPCPRPTPGGPSLWNLLYKNIGKDLSQVSMPVTINEPLNMLQRLCEELEYSELLDAASECQNAIERMALVAAFAVSAYAATAHRAASKPFNPLLHETYECVRTDRGFRFIAEQVSHHPPISACHAESNRWCFWQEARIKTKFWGKSMEFQPTGRAHVRLLATGDHYSWNKVTTCVHNLFGGQRWVDQYGDMHITCHGTDITCKLNFIKASSWSSSRHEVRGAIFEGGACKLRLHGRWSEAFYAGEPPAARCLWRPGAMPPDHDLYYGFTRFAMELNELEPGMKEVLPHTDTRLRPDQRALEEGDVDAAEQYKHSLEQAQRERRRDRPDQPPAWFRKAVEDGEETWVFSGDYWRARDAGFPSLRSPRVW